MKNILQDEWVSLLEEKSDKIILDVRTPQEYQSGIQPNAINLDIFDTERFLSEIDKYDRDKAYFVYCRSGGRSGQACSILESKGFKETYNLIGGMMEWQGDIVRP